MENEQVIQFLKSNENFLAENGFQQVVEKPIETIVEKEVELTQDRVESYINDNQALRDKLHNNSISKYLKKQLGVEEVSSEMLGKKIILEESLTVLKNNAVDFALKHALKDAKHSELLIKEFDKGKISITNEGITGLDDQINSVREKYPDLFSSKSVNTPPPPPGGSNRKSREELESMPMDARIRYKRENPDYFK